jgi:hypothetical protein
MAGDDRALAVRGACGVPAQAVAVLLEVRSQSFGEQAPQMKVWAGPEPRHGVLEEAFGPAVQERSSNRWPLRVPATTSSAPGPQYPRNTTSTGCVWPIGQERRAPCCSV